MAQNVAVQIYITAKNLANSALAAVKGQVDSLKASVSSLKSGLAELGLALGMGAIVRYLVQVNSEYGTLITRLQTLTGSATAAKAAFSQLNQLAQVTPFNAQQWVEAYLILKNQGIDPSIASMRAFGDFAAAYGETVDRFAEAVRGAVVGNYRALRTFGIGMMVDGDHIVATFRGHKEVIGKDAQDIVTYLQKIGQTKFAGGMDREAQTLGGALKRDQSAVEALARALGDAGLTHDLVDAANAMDGFVRSGTGVDKLAVDYKSFIGVLATVIDAFELVAHAAVFPIELVASTVMGVFHTIVGTVTGSLILIAAALDAFTANKFNLAGKMAGFAGAQFKDAGTDFGHIADEFNSLGSDIGEKFAKAVLRGEDVNALAARAAAHEGNPPTHEPDGIPDDGLATASSESLGHPKKDRSEQEAAKGRAQYLRDLEARANVLRELIELNDHAQDSAQELVAVEDLLSLAVRKGNVNDEQRVSLLRTLMEARKTRKAAGFLTLDEQLAKNVDDLFAANRKQQKTDFNTDLKHQNDRMMLDAVHTERLALAPNIIGGTQNPDGTVTGGKLLAPGTNKLLAELADGLKRAAGEGQKFDDVMAHIGIETMNAFGSAVERAFDAMVTGSEKGAKAFESAMLGALGAVAQGFGQFFMQRATAEFAAGVGDLSNPITAPEAAGHFTSAAEWTGAALGMFAIAGALSGSASRVAGSGSRAGTAGAAGASNSALSSSAQQGDATLVIEGGVLDTDNPRQMDALANALAALSGRRVTIKRK